MKSIFNLNITAPLPGAILSIQAGYRHFAFSLSDKATCELYSLQYFSIENWDAATVSAVIDQLPDIAEASGGIEIAYDTGDITMIPVAGYEEGKLMSMDKALNPFRDAVIFRIESLAEWQFYIGYRVPAPLYRSLEQRYPEARVRHALKLALQQGGAVGMQGKLLVNFRPDQLTVILLRNNRLQLAQEYSYSQPADILYHLLKICQEHALSQQEVELNITGLLDRESSLFRELWNYFLQISCREAVWSNQDLSVPKHYFTTLNDLSQCV